MMMMVLVLINVWNLDQNLFMNVLMLMVIVMRSTTVVQNPRLQHLDQILVVKRDTAPGEGEEGERGPRSGEGAGRAGERGGPRDGRGRERSRGRQRGKARRARRADGDGDGEGWRW